MIRRTVIRVLAAAVPFGQLPFPGKHSATLEAMAATVLPASLGDAELRRITNRFAKWVQDYRAGAEMEAGYGFTKLQSKPPSPATVYLEQLAAFSKLPPEKRRASIEAAFNEVGVKALPAGPNGKLVALDLMAFYFRGSDAYDRCFDAAIRREECRGFQDFDEAPRPLKK